MIALYVTPAGKWCHSCELSCPADLFATWNEANRGSNIRLVDDWPAFYRKAM